MPAKAKTLHGNVPDKCKTALLLVDVINPLDFPEAPQLMRYLPAMSARLRRFKERAKKAGVPAIYVNDNFGRWRSDFRAQVEHCLSKESRGRDLVRELEPEGDDYFVLKPKHSGFFASTLETLLLYLGAERLIITGIAGNFCVLFTANDAYMRDFELAVPSDCAISNTEEENQQALEIMSKYLKADTRPSTKIRLPRQVKVSAKRSRRRQR